ncbi:hypothetical protein IEQ34_003288 [Dendrobium chrysotoxum]|uniref:Uncharacterized protein n=1 Tax=Dendrobium chrysotoxum TaxID=161865 RepID=A0AAV7H2B8_DENCH|nr:hypothetical protein IEQ34_003288 [Dendrobium chrysotoxum]
MEGAKVAMRLKVRKDGIYDREEIGRVVKDLMEGEEGERLRKKAKELEVEAASAMTEGGSSSVALAEKWKSFPTV